MGRPNKGMRIQDRGRKQEHKSDTYSHSACYYETGDRNTVSLTSHVINIIHSIHIFNVTEEVACECEQYCGLYDQKNDFQEKKQIFSLLLFFA